MASVMPEDKTDFRSARSAATRDKIIAVAERLFAERGIEGVSLSDINKAAGQRNKNATHYHFGSKEGLLQAILDKHEPAISARRDELLDECEAKGEPTLRDLVRVMLLPIAEKLSDPDGGREFVRFSAHVVVNHTMAALKQAEPTFNFGSVHRLTEALQKVTPELPETVKIQRGILVGVLLTHGLAEHSRLLESATRKEADNLTELFVANMEDCLTALLSAPPSDSTEALSERLTKCPTQIAGDGH